MSPGARATAAEAKAKASSALPLASSAPASIAMATGFPATWGYRLTMSSLTPSPFAKDRLRSGGGQTKGGGPAGPPPDFPRTCRSARVELDDQIGLHPDRIGDLVQRRNAGEGRLGGAVGGDIFGD